MTPLVAVSKPVHFAVATVNGRWSWRCTRDGCGLTRNDLGIESFASSMRDHVARFHATFTFGSLETT